MRSASICSRLAELLLISKMEMKKEKKKLSLSADSAVNTAVFFFGQQHAAFVLVFGGDLLVGGLTWRMRVFALSLATCGADGAAVCFCDVTALCFAEVNNGNFSHFLCVLCAGIYNFSWLFFWLAAFGCLAINQALSSLCLMFILTILVHNTKCNCAAACAIPVLFIVVY